MKTSASTWEVANLIEANVKSTTKSEGEQGWGSGPAHHEHRRDWDGEGSNAARQKVRGRIGLDARFDKGERKKNVRVQGRGEWG